MTDLPPNVILFHIIHPQEYPQEYPDESPYLSFCGEWPGTGRDRPMTPDKIGMESRLESWTGYAICANCILSPDYALWLLGQLDE